MIYRNIFKNQSDVEKIREACKISSRILTALRDAVQEGVNALEIDKLAGDLCKKEGVRPSFKGVPGPKMPFPANSCVLVNEEIIHAIPHDEIFQSGDIVKVDFGIVFEGFYTDHGFTKGIGEITDEEKRFIETAKLSIDVAIKHAIAGNRVGDISHALQTVTELAGFQSARGFGGHGIGKGIHMEPHISFQGFPGSGPVLEEGMLICIENWMAMKSARVRMERDGWTLRTVDDSKSACFEHMVLVTKDGPEVLTRLES